jgi:HD-GYP domain-containing protein (c-di-GMP phosphodiesterase class II)
MLKRSPSHDVTPIQALLAGVEEWDPALHRHGLRVGRYARIIGAILGLAGPEGRRLEDAARLHDIGKLFIPSFLIHKQAGLNVEEYRIIQRHVLLGAKLLESQIETAPLALVARCHHERWDGRGYPAHLRGSEIPLMARIVSVADVYDAVTSARHGGGRSHDEAMEEIERGREAQFCPDVVDAFCLAEGQTLSRMAS